jgi:methionyl-tRNA formyltransferase
MVLALDEGDVLLEKRTPIGADENAGALLGRLARIGGEAALEALDLLESGNVAFRPQDPARATYAKRIRKEAGRVDWTKSAPEVVRHVRAMTPWPGARARAPNGKEVVLLEVVEAPESAHEHEPGSAFRLWRTLGSREHTLDLLPGVSPESDRREGHREGPLLPDPAVVVADDHSATWVAE